MAELRLATLGEENDRLREQLRSQVKKLKDLEWRRQCAEDEIVLLKRELESVRASAGILKALE